jgi:iron complex outermembrane receptor protein
MTKCVLKKMRSFLVFGFLLSIQLLPFNAFGRQDTVIGYAAGEVDTTGMTLWGNAGLLEEVVVVGYGKASRRDITGAVSTVKASEMNVGVFNSPAQMLQGKVPGLSVTRSGNPSESPAVVLRGQSTLREGGAMEPFYVIDGVPGASVNLVAPDDIVSIDILRDASSTAIYGSRAANGVIMITTRRPQSEQGYLTYNGYVSIESVSNRLKMMSGDDLRAYTGNTLQAIDNVPGVNTDWQDEVQRTAVSYNQNVSFGGAGKSTSYGVSLNYMNNQGIIRETGFERYILHANVEQKVIGNRLTAGLSLSQSATEQSWIYDEVLQNMLSFLPTVPVKTEDGTYSENFQRTGGYGNPVAMLYNDLDKRKSTVSLGNVYLRLDILPGLNGNFDFSMQNIDNKRNTFNSSASSIRKGTDGYAVRNVYTDTKNILETHLNYDKTLGKHDMKAMAGYSWEENKTGDGFQAANSGFPSDDIKYYNLALGNAPDKVGDNDRFGTAVEKTLRMISFYARANYQYDNRYLLQVSVRRDGSSAFGVNNRWGTFPSVSAGWKMQNENFMQRQRLFSELRWRASYGVSGNTLGFDPMISLLKYGKQGITSVNGKDIVAIGPVQNANPDLKWESTAMFNAGLDFGVLNGRLSGAIEYYSKRTSDLIWNYTVPVTEYLVSTLTTNAGKISNRGIEIQLNGRIADTEDFKWNSALTFSHNENRVESITNDKFKDTYRLTGNIGGSGQSGLTCQIIKEGSAIGTFYLPKYAGPNEEGVTMFYDADGMPTAQPTSKDYYEFTQGNAQPDILYGWQNSFDYKNIDFGFFFRGVAGNYIMNATRSNYFKVVEATQFNIFAEAVSVPREDIRAHFNSDRYIENGSYLRLDNVTLGYTFKPGIRSLKSIRLYCTANNVFVLTAYKGIDPEISLGGLTPGIDNRNYYPKTRSIIFGLSININ